MRKPGHVCNQWLNLLYVRNHNVMRNCENCYWLACWDIFVLINFPFLFFRQTVSSYRVQKYAHGFCFAVLCCGYTSNDFPISIRLTSLALWQSNDCPSASKATLMNMDRYFMWIHCTAICFHQFIWHTNQRYNTSMAHSFSLQMLSVNHECLHREEPSVCLRLSPFSQLYVMQHMVLCAFSLPIYFTMIVRIRVLFIVILKSE